MSFYDRSDYFGASQQSTFSRSALSSSNVLQNINEPTFLIPRVPDVIKVPEPLPPKKPPQPGFDMKTLRKQIEFLYSEVQDRTENYNLIVQQNQQLWNYITELLEANKGNALKMREYVKNLTDELRTVYRERMEYAEKLELAKNSQEMLLSLNRELEQSSLTKEELNKRRQEAQNELIRAKKEREELQQILQEKLNQVENYEEQLQEMRYAKYEQDTIDKADDFYYSNKIVLKSAYHRFRQGVKQRLKLMKIHEILQNKLYYYYLKVKTFQQWHHYRLIQRKMKKSQINRRKEALLLFFTKWKVFRALETLFQRSARRRLLTSCFINWKDYLKSCYDDKADERKLIAFKLHLIKKKFFHSWKRSVLFLSWYSPHTLALEQKAIEYFRFKIFRCWQRLYYQEKAVKQDRLYYINLIRLKSHWKAWHLLAHRQWKMRGRLLRRFFFSLRQRLGNHSHFHQLHRQARHYSLHKEKKKFLQRWRQWFLSTRKRRQTSRPRAEQLSHSRMRRRLKSAFLHLQYTVAMDRRQRLSLTYAVRYWRVERLSLALGKLKGRGVSKFIARRHYLSRNFNLFIRKSRLDRQRHEYAIHRRNQSVFFEKKLKKFRLMISLQKWLSTIRQKKSNLLLHLLVHQKTVKSQLHQHWRVWKALFFKRIYWKHREQMVENSRLTSLVTLYERQSSDIIEEYQKTVTEKDQLEETILQLQELIANKSNQLEKQLTVIEQQKVEKSKTQELIDQLHLQIEQLEIQEKQWKLLELSYREEKEKEMKEREKKKKETLHYLTNLQQQSINLHQQFLQNNLNTSEGDREGVDMDYHAVLQDLSDVLSEREQEKSQSLLSLQESASELKLLESDEESLTIEIDKVQKKMKEITHESDVMLKDNQKLLRERVSEVRVLREDASLAQARVTSLLEIANEYKQENVGGRMTLTEINEEQRGRRVDTNEEEEVAMMQALKKKHEDEFATLLAGATVQTPATATTHAVTSLAVSPIGRRERVSSMESKDSPSDASSSSLSLGSEDVRFQDARNTIRMLSQKLSTPTASHLTAASLDSRRVSSIPAGSVGGVRRSASGDIDHAIKKLGANYLTEPQK